MLSLQDSNQVQRLPKSAHPVGTLVFCTHCFQTLGRETYVRTREVLLAKHKCLETQWPKRPAAPPPYN